MAGAAGAWFAAAFAPPAFGKGKPMYGLIGSITATPGNGDVLVGHLLAGLRDMPGNLVYIVGKDAANPDKLWVTEVWTDAASHMASLKLPQVQTAIAKARPIIAAMGDRQEFLPVGGVGLPEGVSE